MKAPDTLTGGVFAIIGIAVIVLAWHFPSTPSEVGPGFFPTIIASILFLSGLAIAVGAALDRGAKPVSSQAGSWLRDRRALVALGSVPLAIVGWAVLAAVAGAMLASILIVALLAIAWGARTGTAVTTGVVSGIVVHLFFGIAMRVPLPQGLLERLLQ